MKARRVLKGDFSIFWRNVEKQFSTGRNFLAVDGCLEFGDDFGASKLEQTLSRFFWFFGGELKINLAEFSGQILGLKQGFHSANSAETLGPAQYLLEESFPLHLGNNFSPGIV